uniref:Uncharacterized protein n=1 Tax=Anopheles maculatus TaxID=74869 RepID=A0A182S8C8_9DIPT
MLLQLDGAIEVSSSIERSQRSSHPAKENILARNEDIASTVLKSAELQNTTTPTGIRSYTHVTVAMAQGNTNSTHVPKATPPTTLTASTPTEQPARKADILIYPTVPYTLLPTVSPETIVVPILSCIVGFPIFALLFASRDRACCVLGLSEIVSVWIKVFVPAEL